MNGVWLVSYVGRWLFVIAEGILLMALARQIGILHTRLGSTGARMIDSGLQIGDPAPQIALSDLSGRSVSLGSLRGKRTLLVFLTERCPNCRDLLPGLKTWSHTEFADLETVIVTPNSNEDSARSFVMQNHLESIPFIVSPKLAQLYQVTTVPYGILVDSSGSIRSKGLINNLAHLESLLTAEEVGHPSVESVLDLRRAHSVKEHSLR